MAKRVPRLEWHEVLVTEAAVGRPCKHVPSLALALKLDGACTSPHSAHNVAVDGRTRRDGTA